MKTLLLISALLLNFSLYASETVAVGDKLPCGATKGSADRVPGKMIEDNSSDSIKTEKPSGTRQ